MERPIYANLIEFCSYLLGALFDVNMDENKLMLQYAIEQVNEKLLAEEEFRLEGAVSDIMPGDEYNISRALCGLLEVSYAKIHYSFSVILV